MKKSNKIQSTLFRQKAGELLSTSTSPGFSSEVAVSFSEVESLRLIQELKVHKIELELQNEELRNAKEVAEVANNKYIGLYDLAPSGYFTLSGKGKIIELNLAGAQMLGKVRQQLEDSLFDFFVSEETKPVFNRFLEKVFKCKEKQSCEVTLKTPGNQPVFVHLSGIVAGNRTQCMITAVDVSEQKLVENELKEKTAILNNLIINSQEGILLEDSNRKIVLTNQLFCDMFAIPAPPEALTGASCAESAEQNKHFFKNPEKFVAGINLILANQKPVFNDELELLDGRHFERDYIPTWLNKVYFGHLWKYRDITERKQAQQKLYASEDLYRSIFEGSADGILIADAETKMITYSNAAQCRIFGYTEEQFRTMSIADIHPQETFGYALAEFESMLRKQKGLAENIECRKKNGEIFLADISATLITLNGKNQLLGFFRDITTRKKAEAALRQSEEQRESILNSVIDVVWSLSWPDMKINFISPSVAQLFGRPLEECMTNPALWTDAVHPDDKDVSEKAFEQLKKEGSAVRECRIVRPDGSIVWINDKSKIITDNEGKPIRIDGVSIDITERKIAEQKISDLNKNLELTVVQRTEQFKEALSRLEKIADRVPGVVYQYRLNPDGSSCFPYASEGIRDIYGVSPEEVAHDALAVFTRLHPDDFDGVVASIRESGKNISLWQHEYRVKFSDGTVNWLSGNAMPQTEEDGTILWHGHISDITWRKKEEEALIDAKNEAEKANLAKSEFLSRMSHELRTPMNSILGFAQLMEMGELSKKQKKGITHILNNGRHLLDLINEVLDISGIEAGRQMLNPEPVQLTGIINEITEGMQVAANKRKVSVEFVDSPTNSLFVIADRLRLKQILINLLNNAVKYNVEEGSVTITTALKPAGEQENKLIRISITDTGVGIKPENIGKLFQPFERIGADKTETEGTGLGLMMVKRLAEAMGGTVGVESVSGAGSNFWIELPLSENQNKDTLTANDEVNKQLQVIKHEATILYIEDNISNIELVEDILMVHHPKMRLVTSMYGKQTIELALQYNPGLILLDLDLPDMNGMEVLEKLLAYPLTKSIPVIIISADAMPFQVEKLKKAGAGEYLTKPLDVVEFLKTIDLYIKK